MVILIYSCDIRDGFFLTEGTASTKLYLIFSYYLWNGKPFFIWKLLVKSICMTVNDLFSNSPPRVSHSLSFLFVGVCVGYDVTGQPGRHPVHVKIVLYSYRSSSICSNTWFQKVFVDSFMTQWINFENSFNLMTMEVDRMALCYAAIKYFGFTYCVFYK